MKKIIALLLTVLIFLLSIPCIYAVEIETPGTYVPDDSAQTNAVAWAKSQIGVGLDYDGYAGNQCVDLIFYYYTFLGVGSYGGDASAYIWNSLPSGWQRITYTSGFVPQPGDIAVWKVNHYCNYCSTNEYGHIGIITSANASTMTVVNQRYNNQLYCSSNNFPTNVLQCIIRPNFSSMSSKVSVAFSTFTDKQNIGTTNAVLATKATLTGAVNSSISKCGLVLYNYDGNKLTTITENTLGSPNFSGEAVAFAWYDLNSEGNYTLAPGTTYKYKFFVEIFGTTHYSNTLSFKTSGTHSHVFSGDTCTTCGYTKDPCATGHSYKTTWSKDDSKHWHACAGCSDRKDEGNHIFDNACDTSCNTCGYTRTITHSYKTTWEKNGTQHWHICSVCGTSGEKSAHQFVNASDANCDICGYVREVVTTPPPATEPEESSALDTDDVDVPESSSAEDTSEPETSKVNETVSSAPIPTDTSTPVATDPEATTAPDTTDAPASDNENGTVILVAILAAVGGAGIAVVTVLLLRRKK